MTAENEIDEATFENLPSTDIEVFVHVHFGMAGSFPLRLAEVFFGSDGLHIVEYGYITPLFGLGTKKHRREAKAMQAIYDTHGIDEVLLQGDSATWLDYGTVERVVFYDGGRFGRPKLTIYTDEHSYAYRLHDEESPTELATDIEACTDQHDFAVEIVSGIGYSPHESIRRFFS